MSTSDFIMISVGIVIFACAKPIAELIYANTKYKKDIFKKDNEEYQKIFIITE
jgi:hypothetical protein